jgi:hypothetical protein
MRRRNIRSSGELKRVGETLRCGHVFHRQCILPWFLNVENDASDNCPMCRQHIRFSNKVGMFNWRLFSRKIHLWNIAELDRQEEEYDQDYQYDQDYEAANEDEMEGDNEDTDNEDTDNEDTYNEDTDNEDTDNEDTDNEDTDNEDELSSISSSDDSDESDWFDADDWTWEDAPLRQQPPPPPQSWTYYDMQLSFIKFTTTQQKLTLAKLHGMRFNPLTNNICRNRHR